jgi:two-component system, OmpR family, sensor histidine kinase SenX3
MNLRRHRKAVFILLGAGTVTVAAALNIGWVVLNWRAGLQLVLGVVLFAVIITGVVLNTTFLIREIRRNEQHNNFINAVTHELKTPVASIRLYLETLQSRNVDEARRERFYGAMLEDTDRLLHTIEQVLKAGQVSTFSKSTMEPVSLVETITQCLPISVMRHRLPDSAVSFANHLPAGLSDKVMGDAADLRTAVLNLLDNAVKYSGSNVSVLVELDRGEKDHLLVRIKDQGIGIPEHELKNVFQRFHRIQNATTARIKGTGLGLFIVHSVAKSHKGRISAASEGHGLGSTFTLQLPSAPKEA